MTDHPSADNNNDDSGDGLGDDVAAVIQLARDTTGLPPQPYTTEGFATISTDIGIEWRWNLRARRTEWRSLTAEPADADTLWAEVSDRRHAWFRDVACRFYQNHNSRGVQPWKPATTDYELMLNAHLLTREVDPFEEWLNDLPEWDHTDRAETLLTRIFGAADNELNRWASRYPLIAAVERTHQPGCKIDEHPVLFGPQGIGKSALFANLMPERARMQWFGDDLELDSTSKEQAEAMDGRVLVEIAELTGITRADIRAMKKLLTRQNDGQHRAAYARNAENTPRRCAIVMTANPETARLPNDPSGNRRFVAVHLPHRPPQPIETILTAERNQLWAETLHKYRTGIWPTARLPRQHLPQQTAVNETMRDSDHAIEERLAELHAPEPCTFTEICHAVDIDTNRNGPRVRSALYNLGWTYTGTPTKRDGRSVRLWTPPRTQPDRLSAKYVIGSTPFQNQARLAGLDPETDF